MKIYPFKVFVELSFHKTIRFSNPFMGERKGTLGTNELRKFLQALQIKETFTFLHYVKSVQIPSNFWSVFSALGLNTKRCEVSLRIQSKCRKIKTRNYSVFGHFSRCVILSNFIFLYLFGIKYRVTISKSYVTHMGGVTRLLQSVIYGWG